MWHKLQPKDFERLLRSSGAYQAVAAQATIEHINRLLVTQLNLSVEDAQAVQVVDKMVLVETDVSAASAEIRLQETFLIDELAKKGVQVMGFRFRAKQPRSF